MKEVWKSIELYEDRYEVSNLGNVKSLPRVAIDRNGRTRRIDGRVLKPCIGTRGYAQVTLSIDGSVKQLSIHKLVAIAFVPNPDNLKYINHKDMVKTHNVYTNLEWCTASENMIHARLNGACAFRGSK